MNGRVVPQSILLDSITATPAELEQYFGALYGGNGPTLVTSIRIRSGNKRKGGQGTGEGGGQTIASIKLRSGNKRRSGNADLTWLEKSDLSRDFFSCLDCDSDRKDFLDFFRFSLTIFSENGGRRSHLGWNLMENPLGAFLGPVGTSNSVVGCHMCLKRIKTQIGDFEKLWREIGKWGTKKFWGNVWSDFLLDRR